MAEYLFIALLGTGPMLGLYAFVQTEMARRRVPRSYRYCENCGYDLIDLGSQEACPECGSSERWRFAPSVRFSKLLIWNLLVGSITAGITLLFVVSIFENRSIDAIVFTLPFTLFPLGIGAVLAAMLQEMPKRYIYTAIACTQSCAFSFAALAVLNSAVWNTGAQSGLVVLVLPIFHASGAGLGFWISYVVSRPRSLLRPTA